jgi:predicted XRE-type DNA-binding protein
MEPTNFQEKIQALESAEDLIGLGRDASELRQEFEDFIIEAERVEQVKRLEATDLGSSYEEHDYAPMKEAFFDAYKSFQEKRKKQVELKTALENENLKQKKALVERLKDVIENEEKIGTAFNAYKEIHENWKKVGDIPRDKRETVQKEYSRLLEIFFYNIKIYKELKEHDYKRNQQLKEAIIFKLKQLRTANLPVRDAEANLRSLQDEWEEIGPVQNEEWESLKNAYWETVRGVYEKFNEHYEQQRVVLKENIDAKKALIEKLLAVNHEVENVSSAKEWDQKTKDVLGIQESWKKIGFGSRKENELVYQEFRKHCDFFFQAKKEFSKGIESKFKEVADKKRLLIEEAKTLSKSQDWKSTSEKLIQLQKKWKDSGNAGHRFENKLWSEFRGACNVFFEAKGAHFKDQDEANSANLSAKNELISEVQNWIMPTDKQEAIAALRTFQNTFNELGQVPMKDKNSVYQNFKKVMDEKYASLKLDGIEKESIMFKAKLDNLQSSPDRSRLLQGEKNEIRKQIDLLTKEMMLLENNLGFFAKSKGADALRAEVDKKVKHAQDRIQQLKQKLKLIPNE